MITPSINPMGRELFEAVEGPQGYAFISDDIEEYESDVAILKRAEQSLAMTVETASVLRAFIRKHKKRLAKHGHA